MDNVEASGATEPVSDGKVSVKPNNTVSYETYTKVLGEKKRRDEELAQLNSSLEAYRQKELEASGKTNELIDALKGKAKELESKLVDTDKKYKTRVLTGQIKAEAAKYGCIAPDDLLRVGDFSGVTVDENFDVNTQELGVMLEKIKQDKPYLFKTNVTGVRDLPPSSSGVNTKTKTLNEMSREELLGMISKL